MQNQNSSRETQDRQVAREIHELTYWKHWLGASEGAVRSAIARVGDNRAKVERELRRTSESAR
jgi:hypothetical protein